MSEKPVAVVTGGGKGIGAACCRTLAEAGFRVGVHYRSSEEQANNVLAESKKGSSCRRTSPTSPRWTPW